MQALIIDKIKHHGKTILMKKEKTFVYYSENDKVTHFKERQISIDENYKYNNENFLYRFFSWFSYYFFAVPFAFVIFKVFKRVNFHNKKVLKNFKNTGYFIYANHTNQFGDGFCPGLICFPQKPNIIVHPFNISIPLIGKFNKMWGAIPIPANMAATKNFYSHIKHVLSKNQPILIYPESELWPYYTKIRNFSSTSFRYPIKYNKPIFIFTTVYTKRKFGKRPKIQIYVDGPFYINNTLPEKVAQQAIRDVVYNKMKERANLSNYEFVKYIKRSNND